MKVKLTCITTPELVTKLNEATLLLEENLNFGLINKNYGAQLENFFIVIVAVYSNQTDNIKFCKKNDSVSRYKDMFSGAWIKFISVALPFNPDELMLLTINELLMLIKTSLVSRLNNINLAVPTDFEYKKFKEDVLMLIE